MAPLSLQGRHSALPVTLMLLPQRAEERKSVSRPCALVFTQIRHKPGVSRPWRGRPVLIIICTACEEVTLDSREVKVPGEESQGHSTAA